MPSYLGIILGLMSLGTGIYLVAGTKENDPYIKSKKGVGIFLIILGTILFMIGALYEETYDPTNPAFLQAQAPLESAALENNTQGNGPVNQVVTSGPVTVVAPNPNAAAGPVPVVAPNGSTQVGTPTNAAAAAANAGQPAGPVPVVAPNVNNNAAAAAKKAANNAAAAAIAGQPAVQSAVVGPAAAGPVPRSKWLGLF